MYNSIQQFNELGIGKIEKMQSYANSYKNWTVLGNVKYKIDSDSASFWIVIDSIN